MATLQRNAKRKSLAAMTNAGFKEHGWWIQGERGPTAPPKHCAQLFIGKEPLSIGLTTALEIPVGTILSISIGRSGQPHFYITTRSHDDGITQVTYMLLVANMLRPISRTSKAKDLLEGLDTMASWWAEIPPYEQRRRLTMSMRGRETTFDQQHSVEMLYAAHRARPRTVHTDAV
jgi:hypothetical protein